MLTSECRFLLHESGVYIAASLSSRCICICLAFRDVETTISVGSVGSVGWRGAVCEVQDTDLDLLRVFNIMRKIKSQNVGLPFVEFFFFFSHLSYCEDVERRSLD